jgi:hypothetical protein
MRPASCEAALATHSSILEKLAALSPGAHSIWTEATRRGRLLAGAEVIILLVEQNGLHFAMPKKPEQRRDVAAHARSGWRKANCNAVAPPPEVPRTPTLSMPKTSNSPIHYASLLESYLKTFPELAFKRCS